MTLHRREGAVRRMVLVSLVLAAAVVTPALASAPPPLYAGRIDDFRGASLERKVRLLADREEIRDLIATYAHRAAHRQSMADLFTDDGVFINRPPSSPIMEVRGRAAIDRFYNGLGSQPQQPVPTIHNILISVQGNEARAISSVEVHVDTAGKVEDGWGYYQDRFRRENGRWLFVERDCTFFAMQPRPSS